MSVELNHLHIATSLERRAFLRGAALATGGVAGAALIGCGGDDEETGGSGGTGGEATAGPGAVLKTTDPRPATLPAGWLWDADLPYPYQWPDSGTAKAGGIMRYGATYDISTYDPTKAV